MPFDIDKFKRTDWQNRTIQKEFPNLKEFFEGNEKPVFEFRSLSAFELWKAREAQSKNNVQLQKLVEQVAYTENEALSKVVKEITKTLDDMVPNDLAYKYEIFFRGTVKPKFESKSDVVFFATHFPIEFAEGSNEILKLTDMGSIPGKSMPIGEAKTSE